MAWYGDSCQNNLLSLFHSGVKYFVRICNSPKLCWFPARRSDSFSKKAASIEAEVLRKVSQFNDVGRVTCHLKRSLESVSENFICTNFLRKYKNDNVQLLKNLKGYGLLKHIIFLQIF